MKFRPCIDIHEGHVKQIVGSTLSENYNDKPIENFTTTKSAGEFANLYKKDELYGGHIIMLDNRGVDNLSEKAALEALRTFPNGMQLGGGINPDNAQKYLNEGASHIIVTSYIFKEGKIQFDLLDELSASVGKKKLVLDISCRRKPTNNNNNNNNNDNNSNDNNYYVVTNKWTKFTDFALTSNNLSTLSDYCDEFLVHGVDVEGKQSGIEDDLVALLGQYSTIPVTYAGGVRTLDDLKRIDTLGNGKIDCTVGSALDIFGGNLLYNDVVAFHKERL